MIQKSFDRRMLLDCRVANLEVMKWCLNRFKETEDKDYYEWAKVFGKWSELYKKQYKELK